MADVPQAKVSELVGEHRLDFGSFELLQQSVEEDDALVTADPGEVGVAVRGASRAVHHEYARGVKAAALEQRLDPGAKRRIRERREAIEERCDQCGPGPARQQRY